MAFTLGIDYGTNSVRALFVDVSDGRELATCVIDGAGEIRIFWGIGLPLMLSGLVTIALLSFVGAWNNFSCRWLS